MMTHHSDEGQLIPDTGWSLSGVARVRVWVRVRVRVKRVRRTFNLGISK